MRYFVSTGPMRSSTLEMERRLLNIVRDEISDCVVTDAVVIEFVQTLKNKQDAISKAEPRLRRVEISADLGRGHKGFNKFIQIGNQSVCLHPVRTIIEL